MFAGLLSVQRCACVVQGEQPRLLAGLAGPPSGVGRRSRVAAAPPELLGLVEAAGGLRD